jgi:hypothetical protein
MEGSCEHGNEHSGSIKCWEFLEWRTLAAAQRGISSMSEWVSFTNPDYRAIPPNIYPDYRGYTVLKYANTNRPTNIHKVSLFYHDFLFKPTLYHFSLMFERAATSWDTPCYRIANIHSPSCLKHSVRLVWDSPAVSRLLVTSWGVRD